MSKVKLPEYYFEHNKGSWWMRPDGSNRFLKLSSRDVITHLRRADFDADQKLSFGLTAGDNALAIAQLERSVDYAGPLAGHKTGSFVRADGTRVLVISETRPIQPKKGRISHWEKFLAELLPGEQSVYLLLWLKIALRSLTRCDFAPGQMVVLPGPSGCGKSFLQMLITALFGGRSAKPFQYMAGETNFNADLAGAEHLVIEDENANAGIQARRKFGTSVKDFTVNTEMRVHPKGRDALFTLPTFRRVTLSVNNEPENLMILPPMDPSISDKVMLFNCSKAQLSDDKAQNLRNFLGELPALAFELNRMPIPTKLKDPRFGVKAYHDPEILEMLSELSPETRLLNLVDEILFKKKHDETWDGYKKRMEEPWRGTAEQLEQSLRASAFTFAVDKLLHLPNSCGTYLGRLAAKYPERFQKTTSKGRSKWVLLQNV